MNMRQRKRAYHSRFVYVIWWNFWFVATYDEQCFKGRKGLIYQG
jgi:hypothetical protein